MRRLLRRVPVVIAALIAAVVVVPAAAGAPSATCAASGELRVRVVVDFGGAPDAPSGVSDVCVPVADRATGAELLAARARQLGTPQPRYEGGLLCALDGFPETGCGERTSDGYRYWSYWHGDAGGWTYSNVGPGSWKLRDGDVEGWRFLNGGSEAKAAPPRADAMSCPAVTATTSAAPTTATARPTVAGVTTSTTAPTAPDTTATSSGPTATASTPATTSATTTTPDRVERAASTRDGRDRGDGGAPVGLLAVGAAIVALGIAAGLRFRRRGET